MPSLSALSSYAAKNLPTGTVVPYGAGTASAGFLECDGAAISRTTYAALFAVIGTTFGVGDGSTTFNLPNLNGIFPRGTGNQTISAVNYDGSSLGTSRKDRTNHTGLSATTTSTNSAAVGDFNAAHTHSWSDRYFTDPVGTYGSYSDNAVVAIAVNYSNVETGRTTGNPNVSLNHTHSVATNTVSSTTTFNGEDTETVPGYLTTAFMIKV